MVLNRVIASLRRERALSSGSFEGGCDFIFQEVVSEVIDRVHPFVVSGSRILALNVRDSSFSRGLLSRAEAIGLNDLSLVETDIFSTEIKIPYERVVSYDDVLPFRSESFDFAVNLFPFYSLDSLKSAFSGVFDVLAERGQFICAVPIAGTLMELNKAFLCLDSIADATVYPRVIMFPEVSDVIALVKSVGFRNVVVDTETFNVQYSGIDSLLNDLRAFGDTNIFSVRNRYHFLTRGMLRELNRIYLLQSSKDAINLDVSVYIALVRGTK